MSCCWISAFAMAVDDDAECALTDALAAAVVQLNEKIRCAEASLDGFCLSQVDHTHTVDTTLSGMYRAVVTAIAAYEYDRDLV